MTTDADIDASTLTVHADAAEIRIDTLSGTAGVAEVERLQTEIWQAGEGWIVPSHVLLIVSEYGGILLGARMNGSLVGFVLGFLASADGALFHASHMLGVLPSVRHHGIGAALKRRQRQEARAQGLNLMRWTFDPLEARNAHFNFHKLGTVCRTYRADYYGPMRDGLNRDLPSDRLIVEWHLNGGAPASVSPANAAALLSGADGYPALQGEALASGCPLTISIPPDIQSIKQASPELALRWRSSVREAFSRAFIAGYQVCDFRDGAYVLVPAEEGTHAD